jgi:hypothetical protein
VLDVVVTLQDGRVLDGWLVRYEYLMQCERVLFEPWQIDEMFLQ